MKATFFYTQTQESNANSLIELGEEVLSQKSFAKAIIASGSFLDAQQWIQIPTKQFTFRAFE